MNTDIRIDIGFWHHPKTKRLIRETGLEAVRSLQLLWSWVAQYRPDGNISDLDPDDIEDAADWKGQQGAFYNAIRERWLDEKDGQVLLHDWLDHNPWAAEAQVRSDEARFLKLAQINKALYESMKAAGRTALSQEEFHQVKRIKAGQATDIKENQRSASGTQERHASAPPSAALSATQAAPAPAPAPSPALKANTSSSAMKQAGDGRLKKPAKGRKASTEDWLAALGKELRAWFEDDWWPAQLRKGNKKECVMAVFDLNPSPDLRARIMSTYLEQAEKDFKRREPSKVPLPATWINGSRWEDEVGGAAHSRPDPEAEKREREEKERRETEEARRIQEEDQAFMEAKERFEKMPEDEQKKRIEELKRRNPLISALGREAIKTMVIHQMCERGTQ